MIGLEGSGFTICLGVILLLTGIVMYYCKSKITQNEHKLNSMFKLISALHEEVNTIKTMQETSTTLKEDTQDWHKETAFTDENNNLYDQTTDNVTGNGSFLNHPYQELIPNELNKIDEEVSEDSQSESDNEIELNLNPSIEETVSEGTTIKVVDLGEIEELSVADHESDISEESETEDEEEDYETESPSVNIDYTKMQVTALKKLVSERKLASNVSKLRKPELLNLLHGQ